MWRDLGEGSRPTITLGTGLPLPSIILSMAGRRSNGRVETALAGSAKQFYSSAVMPFAFAIYTTTTGLPGERAVTVAEVFFVGTNI